MLQHELMQARKELASLNMQVDARERKLSASLLSIKLFWGPELDKERRLRMAGRVVGNRGGGMLGTGSR